MTAPNLISARTDAERDVSAGPPPTAKSGLQSWWSYIPSQNATRTPLTGSVRADLPMSNPVLALAQVAIAPSAELADLAIAGPCLFIVDTGMLDLVAPVGATMTEWGASGWRYAGDLAAGDSVLVPLLSRADLRNLGSDPVVVTMIAFLPVFSLTGNSTTNP
jgi:hypothetical protein